MPESFYQSFKSEISTKIWFIDRAGTKIGIIMDKLDDHGYFTHGIWNVLKHYNLSDGAWLKVFYQGCNEFCIKVKDLSASKVKCPLPAKEIDFVLKYLPAEFHDFTIGADKRVFKSMERWEINLSFKQATISNMVNLDSYPLFYMLFSKYRSMISDSKLYYLQNLPADLVRRFMKRDETKEVEIEDENGNKFICNVWWGKRQNQAHLTHGWSKFCAENGLTGGSRILLAIHPNDCSEFYAKVIGS